MGEKINFYLYLSPVHIFFPGFGGEASLPPYRHPYPSTNQRFVSCIFIFVQIYFFTAVHIFFLYKSKICKGKIYVQPLNNILFFVRPNKFLIRIFRTIKFKTKKFILIGFLIYIFLPFFTYFITYDVIGLIIKLFYITITIITYIT